MKKSKAILLAIALVLMFGAKYAPPILGLDEIGMATLGVFAGTILLLIGVDLIWPSFLSLFAFAFNGVYTLNESIRLMFGNSVFWFMLINGVVIGVIERTGLLKRVALGIACRPFTKRNPWLFLAAFYLSCFVCGSLMNTTAVALLFFAIAAEVLNVLGIEKGSRFGSLFMFGTLVFSNISHALTPFGHSVTMVGIQYFADYQGLNFLQYSLMGYLCGVLGLGLVLLALRFVFKMDVSPLTGFEAEQLVQQLGPVKPEEKLSAVLLGGIILWWMLPTLLQKPFPELYHFVSSQLGIVAPLFVALCLMCVIHVNGKPLMNISTDVKNAPWAACYPVGIALFLGTALSNEKTGIIPAVSGAAAPLCQGLSPLVFVGVITFLVMVLSNFSSCTLSVTIGALITTTLMGGGAITGVHGGAMSLALVISAQAAYATPPASAPAAIFSGLGWQDSSHQFRYGLFFGTIFWVVGMIIYCIASRLF